MGLCGRCLFEFIDWRLSCSDFETWGIGQWAVGHSTLQSMKTIFIEFFCVYLRAERHDKVATIKFYFASAVSHATVPTDRLCFIYSLHSWALKNRRENKNFGPDQKALLSERFQGQKLSFWPAFF